MEIYYIEYPHCEPLAERCNWEVGHSCKSITNEIREPHPELCESWIVVSFDDGTSIEIPTKECVIKKRESKS